MVTRKNKCKKLVNYVGKRPIYCGMALDEKGRCPDHGSNTK